MLLSDVHGDISQSLWIYFAVTLPVTVAIVGAWYVYDQRISRSTLEKDHGEEEGRAEKAEEQEHMLFEARIMRKIRRRTGIKVADPIMPEPPLRVGAIERFMRAATSKHV